MEDPNNQTGQNPQGGDEPTLVPQDSADDSPQDGTAQAEGQQPEGGAPELPKWQYQLAGDLQGNELLREHASPSDTARAYLELAQKADRMVELPGDDADEETRTAFLDRFRPESPEKYELSEVPEGVPYSKEGENEFRQLAHEVGLSNEQAKALHEFDVKRTQAAVEARQKAREAGFNELKKEWGDSFDGNVKEAQAAVQTIAKALGDNELSQRMVNTGYAKDPAMLKTFYGLYQLVKDDSLIDGSPDGPVNDVATFYPNTNFDS